MIPFDSHTDCEGLLVAASGVGFEDEGKAGRPLNEMYVCVHRACGVIDTLQRIGSNILPQGGHECMAPAPSTCESEVEAQSQRSSESPGAISHIDHLNFILPLLSPVAALRHPSDSDMQNARSQNYTIYYEDLHTPGAFYSVPIGQSQRGEYRRHQTRSRVRFAWNFWQSLG